MNDITLKGIIDEDFVNYKVPSMTLMFPACTFKCGSDYCQNSGLAKSPDINTTRDSLCERYLNNPISEAIVCQGLEPIDSWIDLCGFLFTLRVIYQCHDDVVIYTGYNKEEIENELLELKKYDNVVVKFGRFIPNQEPHYDAVLGVKLASDNQYAERIS